MFSIHRIPVFNEDNSKVKSKTKAKSVKTTIERQKESRYQFLCSYRHFDMNWRQFDDQMMSDGYDSDYSSGLSTTSNDSRSSSLDQISPLDILKSLLSCQPLPQFDSKLRTAIKRITLLVEEFWDNYDFDSVTHLMDQLFDFRFLNKMSTFIGSEGVSISAQIKILEMYIDLVNRLIPSDESIQNLINSSLIPKLFETLDSGNNYLVDKSLNFILSALKISNSTNLLTYVFNLGFIEVVVNRMDQLKTKRLIANSSDLKLDRRQSITQNNMSSMAKLLFRLFSRSLSELLSIDLVNPFKAELFSRLSPLISRFLCCPDEKVVPNAIDSIKYLVENCEPSIALAVVDYFGRSLLALTQRNEESIVFSVLQLFNKLLTNIPQLLIYKTFGSDLIHCLAKVLNDKRNEKFDKEIINLIENIGQTLDMRDESMGHSVNCLLHLTIIVFKSDNRENRLNSILTFETILKKYCFKDFDYFMNAFDVKDLMTRLLISDQNIQKIGLRIIGSLLDILSFRFDEYPEEVERVKHLLFGRHTDVYLCLERLSFKCSLNGDLSFAANHLIERIDKPLNTQITDQDLSLMPQIKDNTFTFGFNESILI